MLTRVSIPSPYKITGVNGESFQYRLPPGSSGYKGTIKGFYTAQHGVPNALFCSESITFLYSYHLYNTDLWGKNSDFVRTGSDTFTVPSIGCCEKEFLYAMGLTCDP
jgi:hypothetical protein